MAFPAAIHIITGRNASARVGEGKSETAVGEWQGFRSFQPILRRLRFCGVSRFGYLTAEGAEWKKLDGGMKTG